MWHCGAKSGWIEWEWCYIALQWLHSYHWSFRSEIQNTSLSRLAPTWKKKTFVFAFGSGGEYHLGSPCLCVLDYQKQIGITMINVLGVHYFHFCCKISMHCNTFLAPQVLLMKIIQEVTEKLADIDIVPQLAIHKHWIQLKIINNLVINLFARAPILELPLMKSSPSQIKADSFVFDKLEQDFLLTQAHSHHQGGVAIIVGWIGRVEARGQQSVQQEHHCSFWIVAQRCPMEGSATVNVLLICFQVRLFQQEFHN